MSNTVIIVDGYDHQASGDITKKASASAGLVAPTILSGGRFGGGYLRCSYTGSGVTPNVTYSLGGNRQTVYFSVGVRPATTGAWGGTDRILQLIDAATVQAELIRTAGGSVQIARNGTVLATLSGSLSDAQWGHVSGFITIGDATGSSGTWGAYSITVNGVTDSATNVDTKASANAFATDFKLGFTTATTGGSRVIDFDDLILDSTTNWGDKRVKTLFVTAAGGSTQFTPSTGANYENVDDATLDEANYNDSSTVGHVDTFTTEDVAASANVYGVAVTVMAATTDGGGAIRPILRISGTNYDTGVDKSLLASTKALQTFFEVNPATSAAWTAAGLNGAEVGYKKSA